MTSYPRLILSGLACLGAAVSAFAAEPLRVLYFSKSSGFEHSVVKRIDGQPSFTENLLAKLGKEHGIDFTFSKDGSLFSRAYLSQFDVIFFYTSGDLLSVGTDGQPAMTAEGKKALLDLVSEGKGFVGVHAASDTFHTQESGGGNPTERAQRYLARARNADPYIRMLGGEFIGHGPQQIAKARVVDRQFPGFEELPAVWEVHEEWYSNKEFAENMHVLLVMDTEGMKGSDYQRPPYPIAWARLHGKGRVWFNAMGHREDVWESHYFQTTLIGGLKWAGKRVDGDVTPTYKQVTPEGDAMPPPPAPRPKAK